MTKSSSAFPAVARPMATWLMGQAELTDPQDRPILCESTRWILWLLISIQMPTLTAMNITSMVIVFQLNRDSLGHLANSGRVRIGQLNTPV
jgi:hypothetical protein